SARAFVFLYYDVPGFWTDYGKYLYESSKDRLKVTDEVRKVANELTRGLSVPKEKLERLYEVCRTEIRHLDAEDAEAETDSPPVSLKQNKTPADTLRQKAGTGQDIDYLFAALARAAGFSALPAELPDRGRALFFNPQFPMPHLLNSYNIAVTV